MEADPEIVISDDTKHDKRYTILVPLQDVSRSKTLLPPAIRAAKHNDGEIILLSIIEIPYQLPPSEAEQFKLEKEFELQYALQIIETAGCCGEIMVRIAHRLLYAIEQLASSLDIDLIIMWAKNKKLFWDEVIYKKLYNVKSEILTVSKKVEPHFDDVILVVDKFQTVNSMLRQALYLAGSENRKNLLIPDFNRNEEEYCYQKLRYAIDSFTRECYANQIKPDFNVIGSLKEMPTNEMANTCMLLSVSSRKKSKIRKRLEANASELDIPVFLLKTGLTEPVGIRQITKRVKKLFGHN